MRGTVYLKLVGAISLGFVTSGATLGQQPICPPPPVCPPNTRPVDTNGDNCPDDCACGFVLDCIPGFVPVDTDADGCDDACRRICGGIAGIPCGEGEFCNLGTGRCCCDFQGVCEPLPLGCPDVFDPVCGCDGQTYGNECEAHAVGVTVDHHGPCECPPLECTEQQQPVDTDGDGCPDECICIPILCPPDTRPIDTDGDGCIDTCRSGTCMNNEDCPAESYCAKEEGDCDGRGFCEVVPTSCPLFVEFVCGCDGLTYLNRCGAAASGVNVAHLGECHEPCSSNQDCPSDAYCATDPGDCGGDGTCQPRPSGGCPEIFSPVCGCDGNTYSNPCEAAAAGVNVDHEGRCRPDGACRSNDQCRAGFYCARDVGDCDGEGACRPRPEVCIQVFQPVCGCDGQTYSNACFAAVAGVSVAHQGPCDTADCTNNEDCPAESYCAKEPGDCGARGVCRERPTICPLIFQPVCGCDGNTYGNACEAAAAGANIAHRGPCVMGECRTNEDCRGDRYCAKTDGQCDDFGVCERRPRACTREFRPVCGCDGVTYSNACVAASAGVNVAHPGECQTECFGDDECPADAYCATSVGACDAPGVCRPTPAHCPQYRDPVCGCDGRNYRNRCVAAQAGVNIAHIGACAVQCTPGAACDDGNPCTFGDHCLNGRCVGVPVPSGDADCDGDVDNADILSLIGEAFSGPGVPTQVPRADKDGDMDYDLADFLLDMTEFTGSR